MKKLLAYIVLFTTFNNICYSQIEVDTSSNYNLQFEHLKVKAYGKIGIAMGITDDGKMGIGDNTPRLGLKGKAPIDKRKKFFVIAKAEFGANMVNRHDYIYFSYDPGYPVGSVKSAIYSRLGYVGIETPYGELTFGKNWGVYYQDAMYLTDQSMHWSGDALGAWNAGTDGGISGTGRAEDVLQYRFKKGHFSWAAQTQLRSISDNDKPFGDSYGFSFMYSSEHFILGVAYNEVLDGVDTATYDQAKINDKIGGLAMSYITARINLSVAGTMFNNHEVDNLGQYYSGYGFEAHTSYYIDRKKIWQIRATYDMLIPTYEHSKDYLMSYWAAELVYQYAINSYIFSSYKIDNSQTVDGQKLDRNVLIFGINYAFGY
ncbi:MAG: porin [Bacteroidales bacterium]|nr:porin [Bacteroidales bacterium]